MSKTKYLVTSSFVVTALAPTPLFVSQKVDSTIEANKTLLEKNGFKQEILSKSDAEHFVGFFGLLELDLGRLGRITLVSVGVVLHRQLAIGFLDLVVRRVFRNAQNFVEVSFGHGVQSVWAGGAVHRTRDWPHRISDSSNNKAALKTPEVESIRRGRFHRAPGRPTLNLS